MEPKITIIGAVWCKPCKVLKEEIDRFKEKDEMDIPIEKLDIEEDEEKVEGLNVTSLPTSIFTIDGEEKERLVGAKDFQLFLEKCKTHLK